MWLRRTKSRARIHNAPSPKFACSSFKDIHSLLSDVGIRGEGGGGETLDSHGKPSICHRVRSVNALIRSLSLSPESLAQSSQNQEIRIPDAEKTIVVYFTSLRVVRRTFEDCKAVRSILRSFRVSIDERDLSMDSGFMDELQRILGQSEKSKLTLPRVFIGGRYVGGAEEVRQLHECGELKKHVEGLPAAEPGTCEVCGGYRFILCQECSGSHKCYSEKSGFRSCTLCNENGLIRTKKSQKKEEKTEKNHTLLCYSVAILSLFLFIDQLGNYIDLLLFSLSFLLSITLLYNAYLCFLGRMSMLGCRYVPFGILLWKE